MTSTCILYIGSKNKLLEKDGGNMMGQDGILIKVWRSLGDIAIV
jgi:hypothetical protein